MTHWILFTCERCDYAQPAPWNTCPNCSAPETESREDWGDWRRPDPEDDTA